MNGFTWYSPVKIFAGRGVLALAGREAAALGRRVLFVYGRGSLLRSGAHRALTASLKKAGLGIVEHPGVQPNPVVSHVGAGVAQARRRRCDVVLAAGGGSVMDEAKAIAAAFYHDGDPWDLLSGRAPVARALPVICAPTVPASGSETNSGFVITNEVLRAKREAHADACCPRAALLDPAAAAGLPRRVLGGSAVDILSHLLEGYLTAAAPRPAVTDELVHGLARAVVSSARAALRSRRGDALLELMWEASLAANGLCVCGYRGHYYLAHALEHSLSALHGVPHGEGLAMILPAYLRAWTLKRSPGRLGAFGRAVFGLKGASAPARTAEALESLFGELGAPTRLGKAGIGRADLPALVQNALGNIEAWKIDCGREEAAAVLKAAL